MHLFLLNALIVYYFLWLFDVCVCVPLWSPSTEFVAFFLGHQGIQLKTCSSIYLVLWRLYLILVHSLGRLEQDTIMLVDLFEVYNLLKTVCISIGVWHCEKRIFIEVLSTRIEVDYFQIFGIIMSWTVLLIPSRDSSRNGRIPPWDSSMSG